MKSAEEFALEYFNEPDNSLFALITPLQWIEFAKHYSMYVSEKKIDKYNGSVSLKQQNDDFDRVYREGFKD